MRRGTAGIALAAVAVTGLAGCGDRVVKKSDVQSQIKQRIAAAAGTTSVGDVSCRDDLQAKVKAKVSCTVKVSGKERKVTATVSKVDGDTVHYGIAKDGW